MAKSKKRKSSGRKVARTYKKIKTRRRKAGSSNKLIPSLEQILWPGVGGAGYAMLKGFGEKYVGGVFGKIATAGVLHIGGSLMGYPVGAGAIGALSADLVRDYGLADYFADYFDTPHVSLDMGNGSQLRIPTRTPQGAFNDVARGQSHRRHYAMNDAGTRYTDSF